MRTPRAARNERLNDVRPPPCPEGIAARQFRVLGREFGVGESADRKVPCRTSGLGSDRDPVAGARATRAGGVGRRGTRPARRAPHALPTRGAAGALGPPPSPSRPTA